MKFINEFLSRLQVMFMTLSIQPFDRPDIGLFTLSDNTLVLRQKNFHFVFSSSQAFHQIFFFLVSTCLFSCLSLSETALVSKVLAPLVDGAFCRSSTLASSLHFPLSGLLFTYFCLQYSTL